MKKQDWDKISRAIQSCAFCLSADHDSGSCPKYGAGFKDVPADKTIKDCPAGICLRRVLLRGVS